MAEFPSKVTTETGAPSTQTSHQGGNSFRGLASGVGIRMDLFFIKSIPAVLMIAEIALGLLNWTLIASASHWLDPAYGWVLFVAVTLWILTTILFFMFLFGIHQNLTFVPWHLTVMAYNSTATILYLTAFLANVVSVANWSQVYFFGHFAAAAFFGALVTVAYGTSAYFSYLDWRGDGGNAATSTVPT